MDYYIISYGLTILATIITVLAQAPKISKYHEQMRKNIAADLEIDEDRVNIKATTTEKLGFVGRKEGIAVEAVALVYKV